MENMLIAGVEQLITRLALIATCPNSMADGVPSAGREESGNI